MVVSVELVAVCYKMTMKGGETTAIAVDVGNNKWILLWTNSKQKACKSFLRKELRHGVMGHATLLVMLPIFWLSLAASVRYLML
jgi:hypothetical protein